MFHQYPRRELRDESIYTLQLVRRGVDVRHREANLLQTFTVGVVMRREVPVLAETTTITEIVEHFLGGSLPVCFVIDDRHRLQGEIYIHDVKALFQEQTLGALVIASDLCHPCLATVTEDDTLARCLELLVSTEQEYLPVVAADTGVLQGIVSIGISCRCITARFFTRSISDSICAQRDKRQCGKMSSCHTITPLRFSGCQRGVWEVPSAPYNSAHGSGSQ